MPSAMANYGQRLVLWSAVVNHTGACGLPSLTLNSTWEQNVLQTHGYRKH